MKITKKNLKAILMEEVESILQERETDSVYTELIELFMASWLLPDNLAVGREKKSKTLYYTQKKVLDKMPRFMRKMLGITGKVLELKPEVIEEKVALAKSIEGIEKVFPDPESIRGLFETKVNIVYDKSDEFKNVQGWFDTNDGEVSINLAHPTIGASSSRDELDNIPDAEFAIVIIANQNVLLQVFLHEMTHMINYHRRPEGSARSRVGQASVPTKAIRQALLRAKGKKAASGQISPALKQAVKYANSTEEMQARLIHILRDLRGTIHFRKEKNNPDYLYTTRSIGSKRSQKEIDQLVDMFAKVILFGKPIPNNTFVDLVSVVIKLYDLYYPSFVQVKTDKIRKRLALRAFDFVEDMIERYGVRA
jgi:hypothetical protein